VARADAELRDFAPGAGAPSTSAWMLAWKKRLETLGRVVPFDYPYMLERRRAPDPLSKLIEAHRAALHAARAGHTGPVLLAGKSTGSRVGCHLSLTEPAIEGLVCFGYPLKGAGKRAALRDEVLIAPRTPILFVSGTRDPLCPLDVLETVRAKMTARNTLLTVDGGDHSLEVRKTDLRGRGETQDDVDGAILTAVTRFIEGLG
jgi:predicted alpha/beta-hydrolase family hydrolase